MNESKELVYEVRSDVAKLASAIIDVMKVSKTNDVQCWLNYGALLGVVRENRLSHGTMMRNYAVGTRKAYHKFKRLQRIE